MRNRTFREGLVGILAAASIAIPLFTPRNTYADSVDEDQKQDPIGEVIREASIKTEVPSSAEKHKQPEEKITFYEIDEPIEIDSAKLDVKSLFGVDVKDIKVRHLRHPKSHLTNMVISSPELKGLFPKIPIAQADVPYAIYYLEEPLMENLEGLYDAMHINGVYRALLPESLKTYVRLLNINYEHLPDEITKEEFIKMQMDVNNLEGFFRDQVIEHELVHEHDDIHDGAVRREQRAFLDRFLHKGNEYLELADAVRSEYDVKEPKSGGENGNNLASLAIKKFYDKRMKELGIERYEDLSREQVRGIATDYARQEFPELLK